mmetsp:Transcript_12210/g.24922  ORF Transcript_12210/g.24922 Transcript_12210/m.24922 type:complete len:194 (-) Transcript_12210:674-1255(-)|eukprot:CAMPEP_0184681930 /NCGR_PEP_ID=MMETSP0312-20130426/4904_1 /TAXON_ID=31354 /ORGANISM="Compsopogon coeruleus, Strain SAG 36.94" /LENGTH=193 /DNA_ID=CAMNT_0027133069 /DNA_START=124 /DNA_END=705 /DNA_ORIENTATION=-
MIGFTLTSGESATAWASGQSRLPEVCGVRVESVAVLRGRRRWSGLVRAADGEEDRASAVDVVSEQSLSETEKEMLEKKKEIARLRAAEKFIELETDTWDCRSCGYTYDPAQGDRLADIPKGTKFEDLPENFRCPACKSTKSSFRSGRKVIAGFAENQRYGFGTNSMTPGQKNTFIFGGLALFFLLLLSGYLLD